MKLLAWEDENFDAGGQKHSIWENHDHSDNIHESLWRHDSFSFVLQPHGLHRQKPPAISQQYQEALNDAFRDRYDIPNFVIDRFAGQLEGEHLRQPCQTKGVHRTTHREKNIMVSRPTTLRQGTATFL